MRRQVLPTAGGGCGFGLASNRPALPSLPRRGLKIGFAPRADNSLNGLPMDAQRIKSAWPAKSRDDYSVFPMSFGMRSVRQFLIAASKIVFGFSEAMIGWLRKAKA